MVLQKPPSHNLVLTIEHLRCAKELSWMLMFVLLLMPPKLHQESGICLFLEAGSKSQANFLTRIVTEQDFNQDCLMQRIYLDHPPNVSVYFNM